MIPHNFSPNLIYGYIGTTIMLFMIIILRFFYQITQLIATLITVYGILLPAMGWLLAAIIWVEALTVFFIIDALKVRYYKILKRDE